MAVMKYLLRDHFSGKENCISENILHLEIPSVLCSYLLRRVPLGAFASREKPIRYSRSPTKKNTFSLFLSIAFHSLFCLLSGLNAETPQVSYVKVSSTTL